MDLAALAKEVAEEEGLEIEPKGKPIPNAKEAGSSHITLRSLGAFARGYEALILRNKFGKEWAEIAEELGFKSPAIAYKAALAARKKLDFESKDDLRFRQRSRLAELYDALKPAINKRDKNSPRAVEVAVKVLEREARLEGLDLEGVTESTGTKAIIINVQAHPDDKGAQELLRNNEGTGEEAGRKLLPAPVIDVSEYEEVHMPDRGDG